MISEIFMGLLFKVDKTQKSSKSKLNPRGFCPLPQATARGFADLPPPEDGTFQSESLRGQVPGTTYEYGSVGESG